MPDTPTLTFPPDVPAWAQFVGEGPDAPVAEIPAVVAQLAQLPRRVYTAVVTRPGQDPETVRLTVGANRHG
jgi:hypothetical protein